MNAVTFLRRTPTGYRVAGDFLDRADAEKFLEAEKKADPEVQFEAVQGPADMWSEFVAYDPEVAAVSDFAPDETIYFKQTDGSWRSAKFIAFRADHTIAAVSGGGPVTLPVADVFHSPSDSEFRYDESQADDWGEPLEHPLPPTKTIKPKTKGERRKQNNENPAEGA